MSLLKKMNSKMSAESLVSEIQKSRIQLDTNSLFCRFSFSDAEINYNATQYLIVECKRSQILFKSVLEDILNHEKKIYYR